MSHEKPPKEDPSKRDILAELDGMADKATNMGLVSFLSWHIDNPCEVEVAPGEVRNIRQFYLNFAKDCLDKLTNPFAKELLEKKIKEYEEK